MSPESGGPIPLEYHAPGYPTPRDELVDVMAREYPGRAKLDAQVAPPQANASAETIMPEPAPKKIDFDAITKETQPGARLQALQSEMYRFTAGEFVQLEVGQATQLVQILTETLPQTMTKVNGFDHALAVLRSASREQHGATQQGVNDMLFRLTERHLHALRTGEGTVLTPDQLIGVLAHLNQSKAAGQLAEITGAAPQQHERRFQQVVGMVRSLGTEGKLPAELQALAPGSGSAESKADPTVSANEDEKNQSDPELTQKIDGLQRSLDDAIKGGQREVEVSVDGKTLKLSREGAVYLKTILETKGRRQAFEKLVSLVKQSKPGEVVDAPNSADPLVAEVIKHLRELDPEMQIDETAIRQQIGEAMAKKKMTTEDIISSIVGMFRQLDPVMTAIQSMAGK